MNKTKYLIAASTLALSLLAASPALATSVNADAHVNAGFRLGSIVKLFDQDYKANTHSNATVGSTSVSLGSVNSVNGNTFVVSRSGIATTTVVANASTVFKTKDGATTSAAVTPGAHVVVVGTTTATSTSGNTVTASIVLVFTKFVGFCKHWMHI